MKRILTALVLLTGLFGAGGAVWAGDFEKCRKAWVRNDDGTAFKECEPLAEQGNADAQYALGTLYERGRVWSRDYVEAAKWYRKAAEQGHARAQIELGHLYAAGEGVTKDHAEAVKWYRKAAEQGNADAQSELGFVYARGGKGVWQDLSAAHMWYNIAAVNGQRHSAEDRDLAADKLTPSELVEARERAKRCMDSEYKDCEAEPKSWWKKLLD